MDNILLGLETAFSINNLSYAFIGIFFGNLIGVLPGIGGLAALSMLLPLTYNLNPTGGIIMLAGIYYGTSFGGAITSILLNLPGTPTHAVVCLDGNPLARQGRGGSAIFMSMLASGLGGVTGILLMAVFSPLISSVAYSFGPSEYFSLMLFGLLAASTLTTGAPLKGIASVLIGLSFGLIGMDINSGVLRFTFGIPELQDGFSLVALAMGLFGITDVLMNAGRLIEGTLISSSKIGRKKIRPEKGEVRKSMTAIARGSGVGSFFGVLPGAGGTIASFMSYALEKKMAKDPGRFGRGAIEGVAGPEAANSSAVITAFIPTLTLGIPGDATMALMLGALMIHNIQPGPLLMVEHGYLFWGLIFSFLIGNVLLMILNIPLIGIWVKILSIPYRFIYPTVLFLICMGVYSENNNLFDVGVVLAIGAFGYVLVRHGFQPAPLLLGFVLGPMVEEHFRRALLMSRGDLTVFISSPVSATCMAAILLMLVTMLYKRMRIWSQNRAARSV